MPPARAEHLFPPQLRLDSLPSSSSPWLALHSRFLEGQSTALQLHMFDLSVRVAQKLYRWAARYPLIRRVRVWPLSLSVAAAAPFSDADALMSTARLSLWVFTLDDLFDEERVLPAELLRRADRYRAIAHGGTTRPAHDSLATALCEIRDDLAQYSLFATLGQQWATALCRTIDGMTREYTWRLSYRQEGVTALPAYEEYVNTGLYSIGGPPHVWAALITTNDSSTGNHLDHLQKMEREASVCIRLANDLQSYQKELLEGKINALVILRHALMAQGMALEDAERHAQADVRDDIARRLVALGALQAAACTETGRPEAAIADIARFVCDFYVEHDYHTFMGQAS